MNLTPSEQDTRYGHGTAHLMPCTIHLDGTSDVEAYFSKHIQEDGGELSAMLRGRALRGMPLHPDASQSIHLVRKTESGWQAEAQLDSFTHWSRDAEPAVQTLGTRKLLNDWPHLVSTLAEPTTEAELQAALQDICKKDP
eukprot:TRINITY_DN11325_c0_g2_i1.p1 TRINITY_DN11325_c0_g2~~TRINITY_DN11325_c0_g2_i1.p1  ORF type:complete len:140 (+),score=19.68 TRINITY_DN11325_c0_g2_i1:32-451(+)